MIALYCNFVLGDFVRIDKVSQMYHGAGVVRKKMYFSPCITLITQRKGLCAVYGIILYSLPEGFRSRKSIDRQSHLPMNCIKKGTAVLDDS